MAVIQEVMGRLLVCAEQAMDPAVGRAVVVPGQMSAWDDCCEGRGQVAVRLVQLSPFYDRGCGPLYQVARIGVEHVRCVSTVDENGVAPTVGQVTEDAGRMLEDMLALRSALQCCDTVEGVVLESWNPVGPSGGCAGGEWIVQVKVM